LRAFLFQRRVPGVATPICQCGSGKETPAHLVIFCAELVEARRELQESLAPQVLRTTSDFVATMGDPVRAPLVLKWLLATGRFPEFRLARQYAEIQDQEDMAEGQRGSSEPLSRPR
jgi:hypothetical protein